MWSATSDVRRRRAKGTGLAIASVAVLFGALATSGAACRPGVRTGRLPTAPPASIERLEVPGLPATGVIDALAAAVLDDGTELLVAQSRPSLTAAVAPLVAVRRRAAGNAAWDPPRPIPGAMGPLRLVVAGARVHLVAGPELAHWVSPDGGQTWNAAAAGRAFADLVVGFDALAEPGGIRIVTVVRTPGGDDGERRALTFLLRDDGADPPEPIGRVGGVTGDIVGPVAARLGEALGVALGVNALETRTETRDGRPVEISRNRATVLSSIRPNDRAEWDAWHAVPLPGGEPPPVAAVALSGDAGRWQLACGAGGLLLAERAEEGAFEPLARLAASGADPSGATGQVQLAAAPGIARIFWIDDRYRESDRRPWNPLGGFPWSDDPEWANNDLFMLLRRTPDPGWELRRLTPQLSRTDRVAVARGGSNLLVAWAGRKEVGKRSDSTGEAPGLFVMRLTDTP